MEKRITEIYAQIKAEFPGYKVGVGISCNRYSPVPVWHIELIGDGKDCPCCHQKTDGNVAVWTEESIEAALTKIRELLKEKGEKHE